MKKLIKKNASSANTVQAYKTKCAACSCGCPCFCRIMSLPNMATLKNTMNKNLSANKKNAK